MRVLISIGCSVALMGVVGSASGGVIPMTLKGRQGQTIVYGGEVTLGGGGWINSVIVQDTNRRGGSGGVLSGFDCDFIVFDDDGNFRTTGDWKRPISARTRHWGGTASYPSRYRPTRRHPGRLFGLHRNARIRYGVATLGKRDARYRRGRVAVDTCWGFLSLGDRGRLIAGFESFWLPPGETTHLFVGDAGVPDESVMFAVSVASFAPVANAGERYRHAHWNRQKTDADIILDGSGSFGDCIITSWQWDLNNDGVVDLVGERPLLTHSFANQLGLADGGTYDIRLLVQTYRGDTAETTTSLTVVPEPMTLSVLALGFLAIGKARRRLSA